MIELLVSGQRIISIMLSKLMKVCPWMSSLLLTFPVAIADKLEAFSTWLIDHPDYHWLLLNIVATSHMPTQQDYMKEVTNLAISDRITKKINTLLQSEHD
eukprot:GHVR01160500.1.p1 GENE.GHVR01160500.1~~GHVR01160500.1.p1  ORF type:complete len:100 (+),score=0.71 GHVR01160500.1:387-686(+)